MVSLETNRQNKGKSMNEYGRKWKVNQFYTKFHAKFNTAN